MRGKRVICISWREDLSLTRQLLLGRLGLRVVSALGHNEGMESCRERADLMILGHSVPRDEKISLIDCFRKHSEAPVLSLLQPGEEKVPQANFGVESYQPEVFLNAVQQILQ